VVIFKCSFNFLYRPVLHVSRLLILHFTISILLRTCICLLHGLALEFVKRTVKHSNVFRFLVLSLHKQNYVSLQFTAYSNWIYRVSITINRNVLTVAIGKRKNSQQEIQTYWNHDGIYIYITYETKILNYLIINRKISFPALFRRAERRKCTQEMRSCHIKMLWFYMQRTFWYM
jgi:hypothetical protein